MAYTWLIHTNKFIYMYRHKYSYSYIHIHIYIYNYYNKSICFHIDEQRGQFRMYQILDAPISTILPQSITLFPINILLSIYTYICVIVCIPVNHIKTEFRLFSLSCSLTLNVPIQPRHQHMTFCHSTSTTRKQLYELSWLASRTRICMAQSY